MDLFTLLKSNLSPAKKIVHAVISKDIFLLEEVMESGFDVNSIVYQQSGDTALHLACGKGNYEPAIVKKLIELGADPSVTNDFNITPIHNAVFSENEELIKFLLENDSSNNSLDTFWNSAISKVTTSSHLTSKSLAVILIASPNFSKYPRDDRKQIFTFAVKAHYHACIKMMIMFGEKWENQPIYKNTETEDDKDIVTWIKDYNGSVPTLQHLCRMVCRKAFDNKHNVIYGVGGLNLPTSLKQFIKFCDISQFGW